jgi:hypothetical protein
MVTKDAKSNYSCVKGGTENVRLRKARVWVLGFTQQAKKRRGGCTWWVPV